MELAQHVSPLKHLYGEVSVCRTVDVLLDRTMQHHVQQRCQILHGLVVVHVVLFNREQPLVICTDTIGQDILLTPSMVVIIPISMHTQAILTRLDYSGGGSISDEKL